MSKPKGPYSNRGPIEYSSIASPVTFDPPMPWIHVESAGSGGLVVKAEDGTARTYTGLPAGRTIFGPFAEITSMTLTKITVGDGHPPEDTLTGAAAATNGALGSVQMSVAPAVAATPIATGTNDPRVCQVEIVIDLSSSDGSYAESTVWIPGVIGTITAATLSAPAAITQSDTNYLTFTLGIRDGAGGSASTVASCNTKVTGGVAFTAFQAVSLGSITNATTAAASQVTFKSVKTSSGQAVTGAALLRITYTVP